MKTFDELFNDFFKRNNINPEDSMSDNLNEAAQKMIELLSNFIEDSVDEIDDTLGAPDKIEFLEEDDLYLERRIWHTKNGDLIKLLVSDKPFEEIIGKSLQEQLDEAVENEEFEKAATIRDSIKKEKK